MHNSSNKSKGYMPVPSGPNMTGFDMGKTSSMMDMMQEGGLTPMSSYQRSFTRPRTPGAALLARALQKQEDLSLLEDYQRAEAERQKKGGLFGSIGGLVVVVVTAEWQEKELDEDILKGVKGYQDCKIIEVKSEDAPKVVKKLRFRNFPSLALFYDGSKKETWKADMDGELDISNKDIKGSIDDVLAEDVF
jgi:hypothetical protein